MAPKTVPAPAVSPTASEDSVSPPAPHSVHGRQQRFMQALEEASTELVSDDVFPYGITVPFKVRDAVPGNKTASAGVFLAEAPIQALKDMCLYLELDEAGSSTQLVDRIIDYFAQLFPDRVKAGRAARSQVQEKVATGPTPARLRKLSSGTAAPKVLTAESSLSDLKDRLTELGKPIYGTKETLLKRWQEAEAATKKEAAVGGKRRASDQEVKAVPSKKQAEEEPAPSLKKQKTAEDEPTASLKKQKTVDNMQKQYCVAGLSVAAQMKMALKLSMEG